MATMTSVNPATGDGRVAAATLTGSEGRGGGGHRREGREEDRPRARRVGSFVVMPSASLEAAVKTAVTARTINSGQSCIAAKRFIVHERV
jgi:succinate-semialdehyde dehydrogenase/glutarate-semialdehyde dehydrogenase